MIFTKSHFSSAAFLLHLAQLVLYFIWWHLTYYHSVTKNTDVAEIKKGQHTLDMYHTFNQKCWDFEGRKRCLIFFSKPELHDLAWETQVSHLTTAKHMFFKFFCRCICCSLGALVHVKLPVNDLCLAFSEGLFSISEIKIIPSNNIGLWIYHSKPTIHLADMTGHPAAQVLIGVERFILGKKEGGGFGISFGEITSKEYWGGGGGSITERMWSLWTRAVIQMKLYSWKKKGSWQT